MRPIRWIILIGGEPKNQHSKRQNQNRSCHYEKVLTRLVFRAPNFDQDTSQRCHRNVDQVANRKLRGLEIDPNHGTDLKVDKQKKDVWKFSPSFTEHADESGKG
jgi:hypothetical protein